MPGEVRTFVNVTYCETLTGRPTDAKNRVHAGKEVSLALRQGKAVYIVIGDEVVLVEGDM